MSLSTLPPELLRIIIMHLDTKSVYNLYEADVVCMQGLVMECRFSVNTLATAKSLKTNFFIGASGHLKVLNLSGVSDLDLRSLIDALTNLKSLSDLDVSYTKIIMPDFLQIVKVRPTLKSICINFSFDENVVLTMTKDLLLEYQQAFEGFKNVTLVCELAEEFRGKLAINMLQKADLFSLKFVLHHRIQLGNEYYKNIDCSNMKMVKLTQFQVYLNGFLASIRELPIFPLMANNGYPYEILIFVVCKNDSFLREIYATSLLKKYLSEKFEGINDLANSQPRCLEDVPDDFDTTIGECVFMFWDKERTKFDDEFYSNLLNIVKEYNLCYFDNSYDEQLSAKYNWYYVDHFVDAADQSVELDYAVAFKEKEDVRLDIIVTTDEMVKPQLEISNREFLSKLNHLSIKTNMRFDSNFFKNLFQRSNSLVTLQLFMEDDNVDPAFFQFIKQSKSIKNIFIKGFATEFSQLFRYLSACQTLENVYLDFDQSIDRLPDPRELLTKCDSLYNINIRVYMPFHMYAVMLGLYKKVRFDLRKHGLNIAIHDGIAVYSPYISVFNIYRLRRM